MSSRSSTASAGVAIDGWFGQPVFSRGNQTRADTRHLNLEEGAAPKSATTARSEIIAGYERPTSPPRRSKTDCKDVLVRLDENDHARLKRSAEQFRSTQQGVLVTALREWLDRHDVR